MDLNSTSTAFKGDIAGVITVTGARFVEEAMMAAVPPFGHKVPMLLGGEAVADAMARLGPYGMDLENFGPEIGSATALAGMERHTLGQEQTQNQPNESPESVEANMPDGG